MAKKLFIFSIALAVSILFVSTLYAEVKFNYGASFRLRQEVWDNVVDLGTSQADRDFFRLRTSLWGKVDLNKDIGTYLKLTNEAKYHVGDYKPADGERFVEDELVIDNLFADMKNIFGLPVDIKIGRQDFLGPDMYGEGFIILDGTPGDGSRTFYFNAARIRLKFNQNNSADFLFISDTNTDIYLPSAYASQKNVLTTSDEQGYVLYVRSKLNNNFSVEPYYVYKIEDGFGAVSKLKLNTVGARLVYTVDSWKVRGEFAHQFGEYDGGIDRTGSGGYLFVGRKCEKVTWKPEFEVGYVYLTGDDPTTTNKVEAWDPLFSRAPFWNELIIYTYINETAKNLSGPIPGYWTNLHLFKAGAKLNFTEKTNLSLSYQYLYADEGSIDLKPTMFSNSEKERGHLPTALLAHKFCKNLDGFLQLEYFVPGDFYVDTAKDAVFFRWQLQYRI